MRILVTGAAGFVGAHAVHHLVAAGADVVATDLVPAAEAARLAAPIATGVRYVAGELGSVLPEVMRGADEVWHFAANADIPLGVRDTSVDIRESVLLTRLVLEAMREHSVPLLVYPSTSGVYGSTARPVVTEADGPLLPNSLYAAGKVAGEALVSAYCQTFGLRARILRLGNVVGGAMGRGIVRDFVRKLSEAPGRLTVLGDGCQRKSYVLVDDVIDGMRHLAAAGEAPCEVYNLAAGDSLDVNGVARAVAEALGLPMPELVTDGVSLSWQGDQPVVELGIAKALASGWSPRWTAAESVRIAAERIHTGAGTLAVAR
ncbi:NAD-dependent epimerase/dehydratase family protein [Kitasatospora sp. NPDC089509]|uniref:NAD-dependent epimerase/dehydratase family protein n=1 Tax=Kitasatospora sp. NPDC089509 TaxID=3364079 RepID=UPI0037FAB34E